jgi:hypothetical protein
MKLSMDNKGEIVFYQREGGKAEISVTLHKESLWLSLNQIAELFGRDKSVISRHLRNVFHSSELSREATVAFFATVQDEGGLIAAAIFLYFLNANGILYRQDKTTLIDGNTLAAITLMIAESNPGEMETVKRIVVSILNRGEK